MTLLDDYLRRVEGSLRCPAERRPALVEELGGHLRDRAEALVAQGLSDADAERQAAREMGPAWLLALRLSAANGWSVAAHVLRETWAAGIGIQLAVLSVVPAAFVVPKIMSAWQDSQGAGPKAAHLAHTYASCAPWWWAYVWVSYVLLLTAFPAFGFAMGRLLRGWLWAILPGLVLVHYGQTIWMGRCMPIVSALGGLAFLTAAMVGARREHPRLNWLAWAAGAAVAACALSLPVWFVPYLGLTHALGAWPSYAAGLMLDTDMTGFRLVLPLPWIFWFAAWFLDRHARGRLVDKAA